MNLLHNQSISFVHPGKYEIQRIVAAELQPHMDYQAFLKLVECNQALYVQLSEFIETFNAMYPSSTSSVSSTSSTSSTSTPTTYTTSEGKGVEFRLFVTKISMQLGESEIANIDECVEYYLTERLYDLQFPLVALQSDQILATKITNLQFVTCDHLEIPHDVRDRVPWNYAKEALLKIQLQKTPRDKLNCIFECFKIIAKGLTDSGHDSADDFLPCVIYVLLKANVPQLHSNLNYINTFRSPNEMGSQAGYFCVTLYAAALFIENLTSEQLVIDQEFFHSRMSLVPSGTDPVHGNLDGIPTHVQEKDLEQYMAEASPTTTTCENNSPVLPPNTTEGSPNLSHENEHCPLNMQEASTRSTLIVSNPPENLPLLENTLDKFLPKTSSPSNSPLFEEDEEPVSLTTNNAETEVLPIHSFPPDHPLQGIEVEHLLVALIAIAVANKTYDARIRVALRRMARKLYISHTSFLKLEESFVRSLVSVQNKPATSSTASKYRIAKVLLAATAGGAALALTGGLAAPIVGHIFGVMGLSALATALTTTTGVSGVAFVGILCGATVTGGQMARKTAGLEEFDLLQVQTKRENLSSTIPTHSEIRVDTKPDVLVNLKQGIEDLLQKTKLTFLRNEKNTSHTQVNEQTELIEKAPPLLVVGNAVGTSAVEPDTAEAGQIENQNPDSRAGEQTDPTEQKGEEGNQAVGLDREDVGNKESVQDPKARDPRIQQEEDAGGQTSHLIVFTDHPHDGKAKNNESLVVGSQSTFKGLHTVIGVPGWTNKDNDVCICDTWAKALYATSKGFGDSFVLMWESHYLKKIGTDLRKLRDPSDDQSSNSIATKVAKKMVYHSLLSTTILQEIAMVDSPWMLVRDRAEKAGILLAHSLLNGSLGGRPATLIGVSMGARVIFCCLEELCRLQEKSILVHDSKNKNRSGGNKQNQAEKQPGKEQVSKTQMDYSDSNSDSSKGKSSAPLMQPQRTPASIVENVIFIGAAIPCDLLRFDRIRKLVAGRIVNCYNPEDYTLNVIYRCVHWMQDGIYHQAAGVAPIPSTPWSHLPIENIDTRPYANNHILYQDPSVLTSILSAVGDLL
eukprot:Phypoly_transcript_01387.p1 GENE.Phypoly_transcript_01387~~Phypoly_transcript_01387.p1  ORF type:complete len:1109 (+),score=130.17 Phypoly_transcript_01387:94-3327(+)